MSSYNKYVTDGIKEGTIVTKIVNGVTVYEVRKPKRDEEVIGYMNLSDFLYKKTPTEIAAITKEEGE